MGQFLRLLPYLRPYRRRYVVGLAFTMLAAVAGAASPMLIKTAIEDLQAKAPMEVILRAAGAILGVAALRSFLSFAGRYALISGARGVEYDLRNDLYRRLLRLPAAWFDAHPTGDITSRCINDLEGARLMVGVGLQMIAGTGLMLVMSAAGRLILSWKLTLIWLIPLFLITVVMAVSGRAMYDRSKKVQDQLGSVSNRAQENFTGSRVVKAFAQEEAEARRFARECDGYLDANVSMARLRGVVFAALTFFMELTVV